MAWAELDLDLGALHSVGMNKAKTLVNRTTRRVFNRSQVLCPVDTGLLRASGRFSVALGASQVTGQIVYDTEYAAAVHNGRRALTIRARGRKSMRFVVDGQVIFARAVRQPARAGRPYLSSALFQVAVPAGFRVSRTVTIG